MRNKDVHIKTSTLYFDRCFEPDRKKMENQLGIKLSQVRFTEILARQRLGIKQPKLEFKRDKFKSLPKQFKRR